MNATNRHLMSLRPYQQDGLNDIYAAWQAGHRNVLFVLCTGGGKTAVASRVIHNHTGASCAIAHRQELVSQISTALARDGVVHKIIGPESVIRGIVQIHMEEFGRSFYNPSAPCAVAGVDTLISWAKEGSKQRSWLMRWAAQVTLVFQDEGHHISGVSDPNDLTTGNKWCKALALFPNAWLLGVTATPERADGKGLGRGQDGVFDHMIVGPAMRDMINGLDDGQGGTRNFLTDYRVFCPPSNLDLASVSTGVDGDYIRKQLALKTKESTVLGDVVAHYLRLAKGKLGVTFVPDVDTAAEMAARFNAAGVPAEAVTAKTPDRIRREVLRRFARREILQLVNVDLFGEGFDLPAIEVVSMARATQSYALYVQTFGRALRLMEGKARALIIDHVGNVLRHGLPDKPRTWSLARRDKRAAKEADDTIPMRNCTGGVHCETGVQMEGCYQPYEAIYPYCPYCGCKRVPSVRTSVDFVDGDLFELDPETLRTMRGEVAKVDLHPDAIYRAVQGQGHIAAKGAANRHEERQRAQTALRETIGWWAAWQATWGRGVSETYRRFYYRFKVDMMGAQSLGRADAEDLMARVAADVVALDAEYRRVTA